MSGVGSEHSDSTYCANCEQPVQPVGGINTELGILLLFFGVIPGLVYLIGGWAAVRYGLVNQSCPICGDNNWARQSVETSDTTSSTDDNMVSDEALSADRTFSADSEEGIGAKARNWIANTVKSWIMLTVAITPPIALFSSSAVSLLIATVCSAVWFGLCVYWLYRRDLLHFGLHSPFYYRDQNNE